MVSPQGKRQCESSDLNLDWIDCYIARTHVRTVRKKVGSKCLFFSSFWWIPLFVLSLIIMDDVFFYTFSSTEGLCALFTFVKAFTTVGEQVMSWCWFCSRLIFTLCALSPQWLCATKWENPMLVLLFMNRCIVDTHGFSPVWVSIWVPKCSARLKCFPLCTIMQSSLGGWITTVLTLWQLCLCSGRRFEDTFDNTQWRKIPQCNQCNFASSHPSNLRTHRKIHHGEKSNKCDRCDYASSQKSNLKRHLKTHSEEKSNKCNQCYYASSWAGHLRSHLKMH